MQMVSMEPLECDFSPQVSLQSTCVHSCVHCSHRFRALGFTVVFAIPLLLSESFVSCFFVHQIGKLVSSN